MEQLRMTPENIQCKLQELDLTQKLHKDTRYSTPVILQQKTNGCSKPLNDKTTRENLRRYQANHCPCNDFRRQPKTDTMTIAVNADNPEDTRRCKTNGIEMTEIGSTPFNAN